MPDYFSRLTTFTNWPDDLLVSPLALSEAGFVYSGTDDEVYCQFCGVRIKDWKDDDKPLERHVQNSPECPFLKDIQKNEDSKKENQPIQQTISTLNADKLFDIHESKRGTSVPQVNNPHTAKCIPVDQNNPSQYNQRKYLQQKQFDRHYFGDNGPFSNNKIAQHYREERNKTEDGLHLFDIQDDEQKPTFELHTGFTGQRLLPTTQDISQHLLQIETGHITDTEQREIDKNIYTRQRPLIIETENNKDDYRRQRLFPIVTDNNIDTRQRSLLKETERYDNRQSPLLLKTDKQVDKQYPLLQETDNPYTKEKPLLIETDRSYTQQKPLLIETDKAYTKQKPLLIETDKAYTKQKPLLIETDKAYTKQKPFLIETDKSYTKQKPFLIETDKSYTKQKPLLKETENQYDKHHSLPVTYTQTEQLNDNKDSSLSNKFKLYATSTEIDYTIEANRTASYIGIWPTWSPVKPSDLVSAGLYYIGIDDRVSCAWCNGVIYQWEQGEKPLQEHAKHFPKCPFVIQKIQTNITVKAKESEDRYGNTSCEIPAKIAGEMGYGRDIIKRGIQRVLSDPGSTVTARNLIEAINEIEEENDSSCSSSDNDDVRTNIKNEETESSITGNDKVLVYEHQDTPSPPTQTTHLDNNSNGTAKTKSPQTPDETSSSSSTDSDDQEINSPDLMNIKKLMEENLQLKSTTVCKICLDNAVDTLFLPCRHLICCQDCSTAVERCPICRTSISATVKTFMS